jgi:hypothetical protein
MVCAVVGLSQLGRFNCVMLVRKDTENYQKNGIVSINEESNVRSRGETYWSEGDLGVLGVNIILDFSLGWVN